MLFKIIKITNQVATFHRQYFLRIRIFHVPFFKLKKKINSILYSVQVTFHLFFLIINKAYSSFTFKIICVFLLHF